MFEDIDLVVELRCFRNGATVRRRNDDGGISEYPVDPQVLAKALLEDKERLVLFSTGLISPALLYYGVKGTSRTVIEYRPPQVTGIWLDGSDTPIKVPLPGLILIANLIGRHASYQIAATKSRPIALDEIVYQVPLPNVGYSVCWGSTKLPDIPETSLDLSKVWTAFFSTPFGNHSVSGKSRRSKYKDDIRTLLLALDKRHAKTYPMNDLVQSGKLDKIYLTRTL